MRSLNSSVRPSTCSSAAQRPLRPARMAVAPVRASAETPSSAPPANVCRTCGVDLSKAPKGCDGEGREMGGLAALPGFGWWPIKAYRPCPSLNDAGLSYIRKGQPTNEVLFGGVSLGEKAQRSMDEMKKVADRGITVDLESKSK